MQLHMWNCYSTASYREQNSRQQDNMTAFDPAKEGDTAEERGDHLMSKPTDLPGKAL